MKDEPQRRLSIDRCPLHGYWAVCVDDENGGIRVTPSKCCGQWDRQKAWDLSADDWRKLAKLATEAAVFKEGA